MQDVKLRSCIKCKTETETADKKCARCGRPLFSRLNIRIRGGLLLVIGGFLIGVMGYLSLWMFNAIVSPETANGARFTGSESDMLMIAGIFGFIFLFGFIAVITGLWQLIFGRRNVVLVWAIMALGFIFVSAGWAFIFYSHT